MRKLIVLLICLFTLLLCQPVSAANYDTVTDGLSSYLGQSTGMIYAFVDHGDTYYGGMGYADKTKHTLADPIRTPFRIGSISKTFVAIAVLQAVESKKLDLHQDIQTYLPNGQFDFAFPITLHHLLTHSAGFEDLISGMVVNSKNEMMSLSECLSIYQPHQVFEPGKVSSYSNYGIALAAYIVEVVTQMPFDEYAKKNIFEPLGMTMTTFDPLTDLPVSKAYDLKGKEVLEPIIQMYPEGSVVSTAKDMLKYMEWCLDDKEGILTNESKNLLFSPQYALAPEFEGFGYAWNIHRHNQHRIVEKRGETAFFNSQLILIPEADCAMFVSFNSPLPWSNIKQLNDTFVQSVFGHKENEPSVKVTSDHLDGTYRALRSNFTSIEKLYSFLIPERTLHVKGDVTQGYTLNGSPLSVVGEDLYESPIGTIKFLKDHNDVFLVTDSALNYVRVSPLENPQWQWFAVAIFTILATVNFVKQGKQALHVRKITPAFGLSSLLELSLIGLICTLLYALATYNLTVVGPYLTYFTAAAVAFALIGYGYQSWMRRRRFDRIYGYVGLLSTLSFSLWAILNNLL